MVKGAREILFQCLNPRIPVRLKYRQDSPVAGVSRSAEGSDDLSGMVAVVVDDKYVIPFPFQLEPAVGVLERGEGGSRLLKRNFQFESRGDCRQGVEHSVFARHSEP